MSGITARFFNRAFSLSHRSGGPSGATSGKPSSWVPGAVLRGHRLLTERHHDLLMSFAGIPWAHVAALLIAGRCRLPWVAFFTDPWSNHPLLRVSSLRRAVERAFERRTLSRANALVFTNPKLQEWILGQPSDWDRIAQKCVSIPYFFDPALYPSAKVRSGDGHLLIRHMGNTPPGGYVLAFFEALRLLRAEVPDLWRRLAVEFYGSLRPAHREEATQRFFSSLRMNALIRKPREDYSSEPRPGKNSLSRGNLSSRRA